MEIVLEKYEVYNPVPVIVGSSVGGLLLLALITAILYKVSVLILLLASPALILLFLQCKKEVTLETGKHSC